MFRISNIGEPKGFRWIFFPSKNGDNHIKTHNEEFFVGSFFSYYPFFSVKTKTDCCLSAIVEENGQLKLTNVSNLADNELILFFSVKLDKSHDISEITSLKTDILMSEIIKRQSGIYLNMVLRFKYAASYVVVTYADKRKMLITWDQVVKLVSKPLLEQFHNKLCKSKLGTRKIRYRSKTDLQEHTNAAISNVMKAKDKVLASIANKGHISLQLYKNKHWMDKANKKYEIEFFDSYFIFKGQSYYYTEESLKRVTPKEILQKQKELAVA